MEVVFNNYNTLFCAGFMHLFLVLGLFVFLFSPAMEYRGRGHQCPHCKESRTLHFSINRASRYSVKQ